MSDWSRDLRSEDFLWSKASSGAAKGRYEVLDVTRSRVRLRKVDTRIPRAPHWYSHEEVQSQFHPPPLPEEGVQETRRFGERAFMMVTVHYDDGRRLQMPWVEGGVLELEGFEGATFEHLGFVDARASSLPPEELWVHQHDLVNDTYRFLGEYQEPNVVGRPTYPDIDDEEPHRPSRRGRGRRRRR